MPTAEVSTGLDRYSGLRISGWSHVVQSIEDLFTTSFGERIMREWYGSFVPRLLGENITPRDVVPFFSAIASAIDTWEPRYRVTKVDVVEVTREGRMTISIEGQYRPRALLGDFTVEGSRTLNAFGGGRGLSVFQRLAT